MSIYASYSTCKLSKELNNSIKIKVGQGQKNSPWAGQAVLELLI